MKETINRKHPQGKLRVGQRLDRTTASMIQPTPVAVTLEPLDPSKSYPVEPIIPSSGVVDTITKYDSNVYKLEPFDGEITITNKKRNK